MTKRNNVGGKVSIEERDEIKFLFERKNGLSELFKIVDTSNEILYEKMIKDMGETTSKFQNWWDRMGKKYKWKTKANGHWEIDFDTCEIILKD